MRISKRSGLLYLSGCGFGKTRMLVSMFKFCKNSGFNEMGVREGINNVVITLELILGENCIKYPHGLAVELLVNWHWAVKKQDSSMRMLYVSGCIYLKTGKNFL